MPDSSAWWGATEIPIGSRRRWRIGPTTLLIERLPGEWRVWLERGADPLEDTLEIAQPDDGSDDLLERDDILRFGVSDDDTRIHLSPRTADRSMVTRPIRPYAVPPGEHVRVWVSSPLWLCIEAGAARRLLMDVPLFPPSNTWFGPSPAIGELCYASRSVFRARLHDLLLRPHRAITTLHIRNQTTLPLQLERVNVPVAYLPLYADRNGMLWTPEVTLPHRSDEELARVDIGKSAPSDAAGAKKLTEPRQGSAGNLLVRAFSSLFAT